MKNKEVSNFLVCTMFKTVVLFLVLVTYVLSVPVTQPQQQQQDTTTGLQEAQPLTTSYRFGYNDGQSTRSESRDPTGNVVGSYSYIGTDGLIRTTHYTAGADGYNVVPAPQAASVDTAAPVNPTYSSQGSGYPTLSTVPQTQSIYPYSRFYGTSVTPSGSPNYPNQYYGYQTPTTQSAASYLPATQSQSAASYLPTTQYATGFRTTPTATTQIAGYPTNIPTTQVIPGYTGYQMYPTAQYAPNQGVPTAQAYTGYQIYPPTQNTGYQYPVIRLA